MLSTNDKNVAYLGLCTILELHQASQSLCHRQIYSTIEGNVNKEETRRFYTLNAQHGLTHWGRATHICVSELTIIGSDNGLSPGRRQAIIWTNDGILSIGPLGTNFSEILFGIQTFSFNKMHLKMSSAKWRPFFLGLNVLTVLWVKFRGGRY